MFIASQNLLYNVQVRNPRGCHFWEWRINQSSLLGANNWSLQVKLLCMILINHKKMLVDSVSCLTLLHRFMGSQTGIFSGFYLGGRDGRGEGRSASFCVLMSLGRRVHAAGPSPLISKNVRNLLADISWWKYLFLHSVPARQKMKAMNQTITQSFIIFLHLI